MRGAVLASTRAPSQLPGSLSGASAAMDEAVLGGFLVYAVIGAAVCGAAGFFMLDRVDRGATGAALGALLGPLGLVIAWVMRDNGLRDLEERERRHRPPEPAGARRGFGHTRTATASAPTPAAQSVTPANAIDELERLAALREKGHLSEDEFNHRKRQLLGLAPTARPRQWR